MSTPEIEIFTSELKIEEIFKIGENDYGYSFGIARIGNRWHGFALGKLNSGDKMMFFLPDAEDDTKSDRLIKLVGAIAESPEHGYGGIERWFVGCELRGRPEDFMCAECETVGCTRDNHLYDDDFAIDFHISNNGTRLIIFVINL